MAAYTTTISKMSKMGFAENLCLAVMTVETKSIRLLNQQLWLSGIMGVMTGGTTIFYGRMDIPALEFISVMALIAGFIQRLLEQIILRSIMSGMAFSALPLFHRFMHRDIAHTRGHLAMTPEAEIRSLLAQKNTPDDTMGQMTGPAGIIGHGLMNLTLLESSGNVYMAILTSLAHGLLGLLYAGNQAEDQDKQDDKLTCFP